MADENNKILDFYFRVGGIGRDAQYHEEHYTEKYVGDYSYEPLLNLVTKELYQVNPFRVLSLPINASMKQISRKKKSLGLRIELEATPNQIRVGLLPLEPAPDRDLINKSIEQLRNPHSRSIYGLFWLWPMNLSKNEGVNLLYEKKLRNALEYWRKKEYFDNSGCISKHNLAIVFHLTAIDIEHDIIEGVATEKEIETCNSLWKSTYARWVDLINSDIFEDCFSKQLRSIDGIRLPSDVLRKICQTLPRALLSINAELAVNACFRNDFVEFKRHFDIMNSSGFTGKVVQQAQRDAMFGRH